jgi:hypothetical protein
MTNNIRKRNVNEKYKKHPEKRTDNSPINSPNSISNPDI